MLDTVFVKKPEVSEKYKTFTYLLLMPPVLRVS